MSAHLRHRSIAALALAVLAIPAVAVAQRGGGVGPRQAAPGGNPVAPIINLRRQLNLTARQLVQLDSIERTLLQRNRAIQERARVRVDSLRGTARGGQLTDEQRQALRARADSLRGFRQQAMRNDSIARVQVFAVLTDSQRIKVREFQAERRGFIRGQAAARGGRGGAQGLRGARPGMRGRMGAPGMGARAGQRGLAPGLAPRGMGGNMGPMGGPRMRPPMQPGEFGPMGMGGMGPGMRRRIGPPGEAPSGVESQDDLAPADAQRPLAPRPRRGPPPER